MSKEINIFGATGFLSLLAFISGFTLTLREQLLVCLPFILLISLPHGAIDNVLYLNQHSIKPSLFYGTYLLAISVNIGLWIVSPLVGFYLFMLLSAYHFGESQFSHYNLPRSFFLGLTYLVWGMSILAGLFYFQIESITTLIQSDSNLVLFRNLNYNFWIQIIFFCSTSLSILIFFYILLKKIMTVKNILTELFTFILILGVFYISPLLVGFSLYFIILHSLKVLRQEYSYLIEKQYVKTRFDFLKILLPNTFVSILGVFLGFLAIHYDYIALSYSYFLIILISSITLPHALVMSKFYMFYRIKI